LPTYTWSIYIFALCRELLKLIREAFVVEVPPVREHIADGLVPDVPIYAVNVPFDPEPAT